MPSSSLTADGFVTVDHHEAALSPDHVAKIRDWLQPTDYLAESGEFRRHLSPRAPGTGLWLLETEEYQKWHASPDHGSLWIKGAPGSGKSVIAASLVSHLKATENCPVLFFFFRNIVAANFSSRALIKDWLAQLLPFSTNLQHTLAPRLDTSCEEVSDDDLFQIFLNSTSCIPNLYCVADALDEMAEENLSFLDQLNSLATFNPGSLKVLMTSRPKRDLQRSLRDSSIVHISLQQRLVDVDIVSYLSYQWDEIFEASTNSQRKQSMVDTLTRRCEGLFLYAKLAMDQLETLVKEAKDSLDASSLVEALPVGLEDTYTSMLSNQRREHGIGIHIQVLVLEAVTHASRPLRLGELASLVQCVHPETSTPRGFKNLVAACCGPLIEVLEDETLQVIHHSFTEFLRGDTRNNNGLYEFPVIQSGQAHKNLTMYCLRYLSLGTTVSEEIDHDSWEKITMQLMFPDDAHGDKVPPSRRYDTPLRTDSVAYREARLRHPFLAYAMENWYYHAKHYNVEDEEFFKEITDFADPHNLAYHRWLVLQWNPSYSTSGNDKLIPTALHLAAFAGLSALAARLIRDGAHICPLDIQGRNPLHCASRKGHANVVSLLIDKGYDPNSEDGCGLRPIHIAARFNHVSVVRVLLEAGVAPDTPKTRENHSGVFQGGDAITTGECALLYSTRARFTNVITALLPYCKGDVLEKLLCLCCQFGQEDAIIAVLEGSSVSANATFCGASALYLACSANAAKGAVALIKRGADVTKASKWFPRRWRYGGGHRPECEKLPIHGLVRHWSSRNDAACKEIFHELVGAGTSLDQPDGEGNSPVHLAVDTSSLRMSAPLHTSALRALLKAGANPMQPHNFHTSALHMIVSGNSRTSVDAVRLLIEHGSDPNAKDRHGNTPLLLALGGRMHSNEREAIVSLLLESGADPNVENNSGSKAIYKAMDTEPRFFYKLLSECDSTIVKQNCWFKLAAERGIDRFKEYLEMLLEQGIDINTKRQNDGRTLYLCCLDSEEKLQILRDEGAMIDIRDDFGNDILHILACNGSHNRKRLKQLIRDGANPLSTNNAGDTLLHHAARQYNPLEDSNYVRWLTDLGVPINATNEKGHTALHESVFRSSSQLCSNMDILTYGTMFIEAIASAKDINFDIRNTDGLSVLHEAVLRSELEVASLLDAGADIKFSTASSENILHLSCRARKANIVALALGEGDIDIEQKDANGRTPLHYACSSANPEIVAMLLKHGANPRATDLCESTPLHACAEATLEQAIWDAADWLTVPTEHSSVDRFRPRRSPKFGRRSPWYRNHSPNLNVQRRQYKLPGIGTIIELLLEAGADVAATDNAGCTALDTALHGACTEFIDVFAKDDVLFTQATQYLHKDKAKLAQSQQLMKAQITLMNQSSALADLRTDVASLSTVLGNLHLYIDLLSADDAAKLIRQGFVDNPSPAHHYETIKKLMQPGYAKVVEQVSDLVTAYSSHQALSNMIEAQREAGATWIDSCSAPIHLACSSSEPNMRTIQVLVETIGVDVDVRRALPRNPYAPRLGADPIGTALHVLASADHYWQLEALTYLLDHGAHVDALDQNGQSPLHIAAEGLKWHSRSADGLWRVHAIRILVKYGANLNLLDTRGYSPLYAASKSPKAMRELIRLGANPLVGQNPLISAISNQNIETLEILLDNHVDVNSTADEDDIQHVKYKFEGLQKIYALLYAAHGTDFNTELQNSLPLMQTLIVRGANLYLSLNSEETLIHFLFERSSYEVHDALLEQPCASRIDFDRRDQQGRTVLMAACDWWEEVPSYAYRSRERTPAGCPIRILDLGANACLSDHTGKTALHRLLNNAGIADTVIVDFINHEHTSPTLLQEDNEGFTPFHCALRTLRPGICELLLSKGANLLDPDPLGRTALHHIAHQCLQVERRGHDHTITLPDTYFDSCLSLWQRFIAEGGSINAADQAGNTALHMYMAAEDQTAFSYPPKKDCQITYYEKLFPEDFRADIFARNNIGETMLHIIPRRGQENRSLPKLDKDLFMFMVNKGLDPLNEDAQGRSALDIASTFGKEDIVEMFKRS